MKKIKFSIPLNPRTKKNSQRIFRNRSTGKPFITQSKKYKTYEKDAGHFIPCKNKEIDYPVNVKAIYYRKYKYTVDLANLNAALHDILVKYEVLTDDNYKIVKSTDGSRIKFDKENPHTEVTITPFIK